MHVRPEREHVQRELHAAGTHVHPPKHRAVVVVLVVLRLLLLLGRIGLRSLWWLCVELSTLSSDACQLRLCSLLRLLLLCLLLL